MAYRTAEASQPQPNPERLLGGAHEWRDVQAVVRTTFQALYDVSHAQSQAVREVERRLVEVHEDVTTAFSRKADASAIRAAEDVATGARDAAELTARRVEEEAECFQEARRLAAEETHELRASFGELRTAVERQRADVQHWRAGLEAGLTRLAAECASAARNAAQAVQAEFRAALQQEAEELRAAIQEKATPAQLQEIVREAWRKEEGHLDRLQRVCDSKVNTGDLAALAALADGKASMADVNSVVQRQVRSRLSALIAERQLMGAEDVAALVHSGVGAGSQDRLRECDRRLDELTRRQQRAATAVDELRAELRACSGGKLDRAEAEALMASALADWVRAAQRGADAAHAAARRCFGGAEEGSSGGALDAMSSVLGAVCSPPWRPPDDGSPWSAPRPPPVPVATPSVPQHRYVASPSALPTGAAFSPKRDVSPTGAWRAAAAPSAGGRRPGSGANSSAGSGRCAAGGGGGSGVGGGSGGGLGMRSASAPRQRTLVY